MKYTYVLIRTMLGGLSNNLSKLIILAIPMYYFLLFRYIGMLILNFSINGKDIKKDINIIRRNKSLQRILLLSALFSALGNIFFYIGLKELPVSIVSLLDNSFHLIFVVLIGAVFLKEKKELKFYFYFSLIFPALLLLTFKDLSFNISLSILGITMLVLNGLVSGLDVHMTKKQLDSISVGMSVFFKSIVSLTVTVFCIFIFNNDLKEFINNITLFLIFFMIYNIVNSYLIKMLHSKSIKELGATTTTLFTLLTPIFGIVFAFLIFKETITITQFIGVLIIIYSLFKLK